MSTPLTQGDGASLEIGSSFAGYRIEELAGRQRGIGRVYVATHLESERELEFPPWPVALKIFTPPKQEEATFKRRFEETVARQAQLHHPNVVSIYEANTAPLPFISMTLFRGSNLADLIGSGELDDSGVLSVIRAVGAALDAAHQQDLIYRRLRPSGVLVASETRRAFLGDFGAGRSPVSTQLLPNEGLGTFVDYISPEEARGSEPTVRSNVYSLAAIAFECLAGEPPFPFQEGSQTLRARLEGPPRAIRTLRPDVPEALDAVLQRALEMDPDRRHSSPGELVKDLERRFPRKARRGARFDAVTAVAGTPTIAAMPPLSPPAESQRRAPKAAPAAATSADGTAAPTKQRGSRRRGLLSPAILIAAVLVAGAASLGSVLSRNSHSSDELRPSRQLSSGPMELRYPADWKRARRIPSSPALALREPVALVAPGRAGATGAGPAIVGGALASADPRSLPETLLQSLPSAPKSEAVDLGRVQAYRYRGLRPRGFDGVANLYVVPTTASPLLLACLATREAAGFLARCERVVSTVTPVGASAVPLAPSPTYARGLRRLVTKLDRVRRAERRVIRRTRTRGGQAVAAAHVSRAYGAARRAATRLAAPPGARRIHAYVVRSLARAGAAYRRMAAAARARSARRWSSARADAVTSERAVQGGIRALRPLGYAPSNSR
jgi:hypothetical protein